jgi:hypothetical protein
MSADCSNYVLVQYEFPLRLVRTPEPSDYQPRPAFWDGTEVLSSFLLDPLTIQAPLQIPDLLLDLVLSILGGKKHVTGVRVLFLPFVFHLVKAR